MSLQMTTETLMARLTVEAFLADAEKFERINDKDARNQD